MTRAQWTHSHRLAPAGLAVAALLVAFSSRAATPPAGTVGPASTNTSWTGQTYVAGVNADPAACPPATDPANLRCDHYYLTVDVPSSYWAANTGGVRIDITCPSASNDFDLYVYDAAGTQVGHSAGATCTESVFLKNPSGTYEVRVLPATVVMGGYSGTALFASNPGGPTQGPPRTTGGLAFGPATVVDAQRTEGEPLSVIDSSGAYWESGPFGSSTNQSFLHRSVDRGDQFNIVTPLSVGVRPDAPPGGGDTDVVVDDQGYVYFSDLEELAGIGVSVSNDHGNSFRKNPFGGANAAIDRQWLAVDNGLTAAATDNTVFLTFRQLGTGSYIYSTPGSTGPTDPVGGIVYQPATAAPQTTVNTGAPCGQMRFDPVRRNLYLPCGGGDHVIISVGHVEPKQRTGIVFHTVTTPASPGGDVSNLFPVVSTDAAGNLYAVWVDRKDYNVYYAASTDEGAHWGPIVRINGGPDANTNIMPWTQAGSAGTLVAVWYGTSERLDPNLMASWTVNRQAATAYKWYGYASVITNALSATPAFAQARFTEKPMHYGQICTNGTLCISGGDRTMADYFGVSLDRDGRLRIVHNDTTSQHHGAHLFETRQLAGPTAFGTVLSETPPGDPTFDPTGDAQSPHYAPVTGPGQNQPQLDFTGIALSQPDLKTLRVQMGLQKLATFAPPPGKANAVWLTRFQALSRGDQGEESYRIFYLGAESVAGGLPSFFAGSGSSSQGAVPGTGCVITTPDTCKVVQYPAEFAAKGSVQGDIITIDVPLDGFGPGRPILGSTLYNVTALTFGRDNSRTDLYTDVDATRSFDFTLGSVGPVPLTCGDQHDDGAGETDEGNGKHGHFAFVCNDGGEKADYRDDGTGTSFRSTRTDSASSDPVSHSATMTGAGVNAGHLVTFTLVAVDSAVAGGSITLTLSDGTAITGKLTSGAIHIR